MYMWYLYVYRISVFVAAIGRGLKIMGHLGLKWIGATNRRTDYFYLLFFFYDSRLKIKINKNGFGNKKALELFVQIKINNRFRTQNEYSTAEIIQYMTSMFPQCE